LLTAWAGAFGFEVPQPALLRQQVCAGSDADNYALTAWRIRVSLIAMEQKVPKYQKGTATQDFVRDLVRLSYLDNGPLLAKEFLLKNGIHFVVEKHLKHTHLDGAAIKLPDGSPLVAVTLRYDRLDNFWLTLSHELAHTWNFYYNCYQKLPGNPLNYHEEIISKIANRLDLQRY
jgi:HTH-type transcriptional regulator/antitoxin HigA